LGDGPRGIRTMSRPLVHLECQTEEDFVNEALRDYLLMKGYDDVSARIGRKAATRLKGAQKAVAVEDAMLTDVTAEMGKLFNPQRFVPFVIMHEF
jgi:hypothetical protein